MERGYWTVCLEISSMNGQGKTIEKTKKKLKKCYSAQLIFKNRLVYIRKAFLKGAIEKIILIP